MSDAKAAFEAHVKKLLESGVPESNAKQFAAVSLRAKVSRKLQENLTISMRGAGDSAFRQSSEFKIVRVESLLAGLEALIEELEGNLAGAPQSATARISLAEKAATSVVSQLSALVADLQADEPNFRAPNADIASLSAAETLVSSLLSPGKSTRIIADALGLRA